MPKNVDRIMEPAPDVSIQPACEAVVNPLTEAASHGVTRVLAFRHNKRPEIRLPNTIQNIRRSFMS